MDTGNDALPGDELRDQLLSSGWGPHRDVAELLDSWSDYVIESELEERCGVHRFVPVAHHLFGSVVGPIILLTISGEGPAVTVIPDEPCHPLLCSCEADEDARYRLDS